MVVLIYVTNCVCIWTYLDRPLSMLSERPLPLLEAPKLCIHQLLAELVRQVAGLTDPRKLLGAGLTCLIYEIRWHWLSRRITTICKKRWHKNFFFKEPTNSIEKLHGVGPTTKCLLSNNQVKNMFICFLDTVIMEALYCFFLCLSYYQFSPVCFIWFS